MAMVVGRFQVMAVLQAARAFILGMSEDMAKSWGLNRAIFYAAAKRGFKRRSTLTSEFREARLRPEEETIDVYRLGDEMAFKEEKNGRIYFTIGGKIQSEKDFQRQIESRFSGAFEDAWKEALDMLRNFDRSTLLSQKEFYEKVYRPTRDDLASRWSQLALNRVVKAKAERSAE